MRVRRHFYDARDPFTVTLTKTVTDVDTGEVFSLEHQVIEVDPSRSGEHESSIQGITYLWD